MKQRKPTKEESDAMDNYGKPLKPQPELPSDAMKSKGGMVRGQGIALRGTRFKGIF